MNSKLFIITFDQSKYDGLALHHVITNMPLKSDWWHYVGPAYIIVSHASALEIEKYINQRWKGQFLLAEINGKNSGGWLPKAAWDWINSRS